MAFKKLFKGLTTSIDDLDQARLREFCTSRSDVTAIADLQPRHEGTVVGEISSISIVPHEGSPWLEATITDGTGSMVAVWTGRRHIAGVSAGKRLVVSGRGAPSGPRNRLRMVNPSYELL